MKRTKAMLCSIAPGAAGLQVERDQPVMIVGRSVHCFRIECASTERVWLIGTWLQPGEQALVPLHAVRSIH